METVFAAVTGLFIAMILGVGVDQMLKRLDAGTVEKLVDKVVPVPRGIPKEVWESEVLGGTYGGRELGCAERVIFFASFWFDNGWALAASWLAFKVASKWNSWTQLGDVPKVPQAMAEEHGEELGDLRARVYRVGHANRRFVLGTALNIVCGLAGAGVGRLIVTWGKVVPFV